MVVAVFGLGGALQRHCGLDFLHASIEARLGEAM
jgi:hypothetical protein